MTSPIVILGAARSGTKFLRDLLATSPGAKAVPYDVNYVWRYQAEAATDDLLSPEDLSIAKRDFILSTVRSLAGIAEGDQETAMIEKTVSNTLRVPFVASIMPNAHFVHLVRDGREVTESAMRMWQAPPDFGALWTKLRGIPLSNLGYVFWFAGNFAKGLVSGRGGGKVWGPRYPGIETDATALPLSAVCARQWLHCVTAARRDLALLPPEQVHEIRYEDLIRDPQTLQWLVERLGLPGGAQIIQTYKSRLRAGKPGAWREKMAEADQAAMQQEIGPALDRLGYTD